MIHAQNKTIRVIHEIVDFAFIVIMLVFLFLAVWSQWDTRQVYAAADPSRFIMYKPTEDDPISFSQLQQRNKDVLGWLTIYDTEIDYPIVQGNDNEFYMNHDATGEVQASGALFLDSRNNRHFQDFNSLIYGHHMSERKMFGDIDLFLKENFFQEHEFGNLYYDGHDHGIRIIAVLEVQASDALLYYPVRNGDDLQLSYIDRIHETAKYLRGVDLNKTSNRKSAGRTSPLSPKDNLIMLSTCSADITNGRFILVCKLLDHTMENPFPTTKREARTAVLDQAISNWSPATWIVLLLVLIALTAYLYSRIQRGEKAYDSE